MENMEVGNGGFDILVSRGQVQITQLDAEMGFRWK